MQRQFLFNARRNGLTPRFFSTTTMRPAINKIVSSAQEAIKDMQSDTTVLVGGFGFSGVPATLINALRDRKDLTNFTVVSNNAGMPGVGLGQLLETKQIGTMVASYIGDNKVFEQMYLKGELSLHLTPQGTIAEKCAAGAAGVPAFYTPAAYGTIGMLLPINLTLNAVLNMWCSSNRRTPRPLQHRRLHRPHGPSQRNSRLQRQILRNGRIHLRRLCVRQSRKGRPPRQLPVPQSAEQLQRSDGQERENDDCRGRRDCRGRSDCARGYSLARDLCKARD
jgi:hypothetical protein